MGSRDASQSVFLGSLSVRFCRVRSSLTPRSYYYLRSYKFKIEKRNQLQRSLSKYRMDIIFNDFVGWLNYFLLAEFIGERW